MVDKGRFGKCARSAVVGELLCDLQVASSTLFSHKKGPLSVLFNSHGLWPFLDPVFEIIFLKEIFCGRLSPGVKFFFRHRSEPLNRKKEVVMRIFICKICQVIHQLD